MDPFDFMTEEFWEARRAFVRRATDDQLAVALGYARGIEARGHAPEGSPSRCLLGILELENIERENARIKASMAELEAARASAAVWHAEHPEWMLANPEPPFEVEGDWCSWRGRWYLAASGRG